MDKLPVNDPDDEQESDQNEEPDPRVEAELDRLNHANEAINNLELQLDEARNTLKEFSILSEENLSALEKKIGKAVANVQPYYDARIKLNEAKENFTKARYRFERAQALHVAAKEIASVSIDHIDEARKLNQNEAAWNETYCQAIDKAKDAEREKYRADIEQQNAETIYYDTKALVEKLEKDNRRSINKSKPYYEMKADYYKELQFHQRKVRGLEKCVDEAKKEYQQSMRNLEHISNEIHEQRKQEKLKTGLRKLPNSNEERLTDRNKQQTDGSLQSCLISTETSPVGVISNIETDDSPDRTEKESSLNDQFILSSKSPPELPALSDSKLTDTHPTRLVTSSLILTDDDDEGSTSLHVLSDEKINHLASAYHQYSTESSYPTGMQNQPSESTYFTIPDSLLY